MILSYHWIKKFLPYLGYKYIKYYLLFKTGLELEYKIYTKYLYFIGEIIHSYTYKYIIYYSINFYYKNTYKLILVISSISNYKIGDLIPIRYIYKNVQIFDKINDGIICSFKEINNKFYSSILNKKFPIGTPIYYIHQYIYNLILDTNSQSHIGLSGELSRILNIKYKLPSLNIKLKNIFIVCYIQGIKLNNSPFWVKNYLFSLEVKPINNILDIIYYILYETGNYITYIKSNSNYQKKIYILPIIKHNNTVISNIVYTTYRAFTLIYKYYDANILGIPIIFGEENKKEREIILNIEYLYKKCGFTQNILIIENNFRRLGYVVISIKYNIVCKVIVPNYRSDIVRKIDLIEEYIRIFGIYNIPNIRISSNRVHTSEDILTIFNNKSTDLLINHGFNECYNTSLIAKNKINSIRNPLNNKRCNLRDSLIPGIINTITYNKSLGNVVERIFEVGQVFSINNKNILFEQTSVAFIILCNKNKLFTTLLKSKCLCETIVSFLDYYPYNQYWKYKYNGLWQEKYSITSGCSKKEMVMINSGLLNYYTDNKCYFIAGEVLIYNNNIKYLNNKIKSRLFNNKKILPTSSKNLSIIVPTNISISNVLSDIYYSTNIVSTKSIENRPVLFDCYYSNKLPLLHRSLVFTLTLRSKSHTLTENEIANTIVYIYLFFIYKGYIFSKF